MLVPVGLGLLGFVEPCSLGSSLIFIKYLEGAERLARLSQVAVFAVTRGVLIGLLGASAAWLGTAFLGFQKAAWGVLGVLYIAIGGFYVLGKAGFLMRTVGPRLSRLSGTRGSATLGILFGLNVPACAAPLIFALFGAAAAGGAAGRPIAAGFFSLALFGLALSLPLVLAVAFAPARRVLDRVAGLSRRIPFWTGLVLIVLGVWSIGFALFVALDGPRSESGQQPSSYYVPASLMLLAVDAYPTTYVRPAVPYHALSVANGARLYQQHCAAGHGIAGYGDGPAVLPTPPADLTAQHTADHTAGDLFWWLTYGGQRRRR